MRIGSVPKNHPRYYQLKYFTYSNMADVMLCQGDKISAKHFINKALDAAEDGNLGYDVIEDLNNTLNSI